MRSLFLLLAVAVSPAFAAEPNPESVFLTNTRQLIYDGKRSGEGYFHPDGKRLIFQSEREAENPFYQIYTLDLTTGDSARVSPGVGKTTCAFFQPGADRVLFGSTHLDPQAAQKQRDELDFRASGKQRRYAWDYDPAMDIFTSNLDGTNLVRLTKERGYDAEAAFSPTGDEIVFCSTRSAYEAVEPDPETQRRLERDPAWFGDIYLMNADGGNVRRLTKTDGYDGGPFFSPGGSRILWRRFDESGMNADIFTMNRLGEAVIRLTDFKCMSWAPYYWPGESYLIFTANKLGFENFELFIVDRNGEKEPVRVTHSAGFDGLPVFSPKGDKLCWTSGRTSDGKSQLFIADWNHQAALDALAKSPKRAATSEPPKPAKAAQAEPQPFDPAISRKDLKTQVGWLAAPEREGRMTGTPGSAAAADWAAEYFGKIGLRPLGESFGVPFAFDAGVKTIDGKNTLSINAKAAEFDRDFRPITFSDSGEAEGEVIFAGYGLSVPEEKGDRYNSYDGLDVKDKIVLLFRYVPEAVEPARRAQLNRYAGLRYKAMMVRERGAKAVLVVTGPNSPQAGELLPLTGDGALAGSGVLAVSISGSTADALLEPSGKKLKDLQ
ncbi:MAG: peptidase M28, partial [Chthoniobacteraceae bacterium]